MDLYSVISTIISLAILLAYVNQRYIKAQNTIALMSATLFLSLLLIFLGRFGFSQIKVTLATFMSEINFHDLLINGMLSFLLFAGALHIDIKYLKDRAWEVAVLSTFSTITSTFLVAAAVYTVSQWLGMPILFIHCLLFGALISPTDPIAVLAIFKKVHAPLKLHAMVECESLFNDGVAIVLFVTIYHFAFGHTAVTPSGVLLLFFREAIGGIIYGGLIGILARKLISPLQDRHLEILMTIAIPTGAYALAQAMDISGPLAMVVSGIIIANSNEIFSKVSGAAREGLHNFWAIIDEILNAILFMLIGLELLVIHLNSTEIILAVLAIPLVLIVRTITVAIPIQLFKLRKQYEPYTISILVWGGLRGGLAVALALALPEGLHRNLILGMTYAVVIFAIGIQGSTIGPLAKRSKCE